MDSTALSVDVAVVGAGPAGLASACIAAESGCRVALIDETPWVGGQIWRGRDSRHSGSQAQAWFDRFRRCGVTLLDRTTVVAAPAPGMLLAEREERPLQIHWRRLVLATGARELFLPFPGWTLPGVMGPGGLLNLAKNGWPIAGKTVVIAGSGPLLLAAAAGLHNLGAKVVSISEQAPFPAVAKFTLGLCAAPGKLWQAAQLRFASLVASYRCGVWPVRAEGDQHVRQVILTNGRRTWTESCDFLACAFGLTPNVELPSLLGCELEAGFVRVDPTQRTSVGDVFCAGEPTGLGGAECALIEGQIAGYSATDQVARAERLFRTRAGWHKFRGRLATAFALRPALKSLAEEGTVFCRCEDVTLGRVKEFGSWREAKLHSRCGMGTCQGRVCGAAAGVLWGWRADSVRPPLLPVRVASLIAQRAFAAALPVEIEPQNPAPKQPEVEPQTGPVYTGSS